jgi:hypothetical protein
MIFILKSLKPKEARDSDVFFMTAEKKPVTRTMFVDFIQTKLKVIFPNIDIKEWNGISLRKGGATSAMRAGIKSEKTWWLELRNL